MEFWLRNDKEFHWLFVLNIDQLSEQNRPELYEFLVIFFQWPFYTNQQNKNRRHQNQCSFFKETNIVEDLLALWIKFWPFRASTRKNVRSKEQILIDIEWIWTMITITFYSSQPLQPLWLERFRSCEWKAQRLCKSKRKHLLNAYRTYFLVTN